MMIEEKIKKLINSRLKINIDDPDERKNIIKYLKIMDKKPAERKHKDNLWLMYNQFYKHSIFVKSLQAQIAEIKELENLEGENK